MNFDKGDIVQLKSGGPNMCVSEYRGSVMCVYYNSIKGDMVRETFHPEQLRNVTSAPQAAHTPGR